VASLHCLFCAGFGYLTHKLLELASGKLVMVLEGGFELRPLCECTERCMRSLLGEDVHIPEDMMDVKPSPNTATCIEQVISIHSKLFAAACGIFAVSVG